MLICPNCNTPLSHHIDGYKCDNGHTFDTAKEGYVNLLLPNHKKKLNPGDNKEMINARELFLSQGYYDFLVDTITSQLNTLQAISESIQGSTGFLDVGCGSGYYTRRIFEGKEKKVVVGLDISKNAITKASKLDKSSTYIVGSAFRLPIANDSVQFILSIFSPLDINEASRVLLINGYIIKVIPSSNHMKEIAQLIYSEVVPHDSSFNALIENDKRLEMTDVVEVEKEVLLNEETLLALINMTPYKYKFDKAKLNSLKAMKVTFAFKIFIAKSLS